MPDPMAGAYTTNASLMARWVVFGGCCDKEKMRSLSELRCVFVHLAQKFPRFETCGCIACCPDCAVADRPCQETPPAACCKKQPCCWWVDSNRRTAAAAVKVQ